MERYTVCIGDRRFVIGVEDAGTDRFTVHVDGRTLDVHLESAADIGGHAERHVVTAPLAAPAARGITAPDPGGSAPAQAGLVLAPMPGTVIRILVTPGDAVARGDVLAHLEAMKMTNAVRAPQQGVVAEVLVHDGQQVVYGAPLVRLAMA